MTGPGQPAGPGPDGQPESAGPDDRTSQARPPAGHVPVVDEEATVATAGQMRALGRQLATLLRAGDLIVLSGPLGAGKTTLTQGIGAGLGVRGQVTSPTFVIARVHPSLTAGPDLVHADAYRLGSRAEVDDLDLDADLATSVTVVEWGEGLVEDLAPGFLSISLQAAATAPAGTGPDQGEEAAAESAAEGDVPRLVRIRGSGQRWQDPVAAAAIRMALCGG